MKQINFMPDEVRREMDLRRLLIKCAVLVFGCVLTIGAWFPIASRQSTVMDRELNTLDKQIQTARSKAQQAVAGSTKRLVQSKQAVMHSKLKQPIPTSSVVALVAQLLPQSMGLTSLSIVGEPVKPTPPNAKTPGRSQKQSSERVLPPLRVSLEGLAPNDLMIAQFIGHLDHRAVFVNVEMAYSRPVKRGALLGREFRVTADIPLDRSYSLRNAKKVSHAN